MDQAIAQELSKVRIELPPAPTEEDLKRRREAIDRILKLRDEIGPINLTLEELLQEVERANG